MEFDEFKAMNTAIQVAAEGNRSDLWEGFKQVRRFITECEARFSRFIPSSELCQLNRSAGTWFQASTNMFELLTEALQLYKMTNGLFDPSILEALRKAGYDRSMDEIMAFGVSMVHGVSLPTTSRFGQTPLDPVREAIFLPAGMQIDLGGIAKGWIAEKAACLLAEYTPACAVSIGGDMAFQGIPAGENAWQVSLEDPLDEKRVLAVLEVKSGALVTSTVTRRQWMRGNQVMHHIIDPRTGTSAQVEWLGVTVAAPEATTAEAFAKAILIGGRDFGLQLAEEIPGLWFIAVNPDGSLTGTKNCKEIVYESFQLQPSI
jgi:thiamine biosynthesis lipoprotein